MHYGRRMKAKGKIAPKFFGCQKAVKNYLIRKFSQKNFHQKMQNLGLKTPTIRKFRRKLKL